MTANTDGPVLWDVDARGVATVTLNRPEVNNAYNGAMIDGLLAALDALGQAKGLRAVVLKGNGKHFQAGADLKFINATRVSSPEENLRVSRATAEAVRRLSVQPVPTVALVHGGCFGGGTGMIAACDIVLAADNAIFSIAEVRWGLHASIIIPQLADAIGVRQLRRYALTGERFDAVEAVRIGLAHKVVPLGGLESEGARIVDHLLANGPQAIAETKAWILKSAWADLDDKGFSALIESHSVKRQSAEAAEVWPPSPRSARGTGRRAELAAILRDGAARLLRMRTEFVAAATYSKPHPESLTLNDAIRSSSCEAAGQELDTGDQNPSGFAGDGAFEVLASLRLRPSQASVRSTTHRRGSGLKVPKVCVRVMMLIVHLPMSASASSSFCPR